MINETNLLPPESYVSLVAKLRPKSGLDKIIRKFGINTAAQLMKEFAGQIVYFPDKSTLRRAETVRYIQSELAGLRAGEYVEFGRRVKRLSMLFNKSEHSIKRIRKTGRYE